MSSSFGPICKVSSSAAAGTSASSAGGPSGGDSSPGGGSCGTSCMSGSCGSSSVHGFDFRRNRLVGTGGEGAGREAGDDVALLPPPVA
eukprot:7707718-Pyramimonas_sp.AAC.1